MKKGKKRLLLGWICLLLSLCMVTVASAETDGTPIQPCHQVTMTEQKSTAQSGASISVWHITTVLDEVNSELNALADKVVYTGSIDSYFDYCFGKLQYRSLRFETEVLDTDNYQGNAVVNYTDAETPFTRIIEHKHFAFGTQPKTVVTREYPADWQVGGEPYYTVNDEANSALYQKYAALAAEDDTIVFGGRLGEYQYYDMDKVIASALACARRELA